MFEHRDDDPPAGSDVGVLLSRISLLETKLKQLSSDDEAG